MGFITNTGSIAIGSVVASGISKKYLDSKVENSNDTILKDNQFPNTTILLPTLNEEWMVEKTLQSIKNQNIYKLYPERFEILLIDSNSEDKTVEIAKNYLTSLDKIILMEERNLVKARTIGIQESRGDLIVFTDADTLYPINWLNSMLKIYFDDPQVVAVSGLEYYPGIHFLTDLYEPLFKLIACSLKIRITNAMIGHNSSCYKWAFNMIHGFDVPFEYDVKSSTDTQVVLETNFVEKLKTVGKYVFDPRIIVYDYGVKRRHMYDDRKNVCDPKNNLTKDDEYLCRYWYERENLVRFDGK